MITIEWQEGLANKSLGIWCITSETHERVADVTDHAVERGASVVDHVRPKARKLSFTALLSNTPIGDDVRPAIVVSTPLDIARREPVFPLPRIITPERYRNPLPLIGFTTPDVFDLGTPEAPKPALPMAAQTIVFDARGFDDILSTFSVLEDLQARAVRVVVNSPRARYENAVVEKVDLEKNDSTNSAVLKATFREIRIVESRTATAPVPSEPRASGSVSKGNQSLDDRTAKLKSSLKKNASLAHGLTRGLK